ncbi:hypothetical protein AGRA3207_002034 [Actinomadura graeca]|uniref:ATP-binding protein n=1 Tax=Actinomadura graeca TaxID=2750812 RepID=A0ABX8QTZ3_9ACTN|nr:hypothetical protein [Actinomadura graeca]QXJ21202.1 hypothetical protein AGRA3207_002034 [Actinomadura graeca]
MTAPARVNPFRYPGAGGVPAPPLECEHPPPCDCHLSIDTAEANFAEFQERFAELGGLQRHGLLVPVGGPTKCGKTSLINRCVTWAHRTLRRQSIRVLACDLSDIGRSPGMTMDDRTTRTGLRLTTLVSRNQQIHDPAVLRADDDKPADLAERLVRLSESLAENVVVILVAPPVPAPAIDLVEVQRYWAATYPKLLIFVEHSNVDCKEKIRNEWGHARGARSACLEMGFLRPGDGATFTRARIHVPGRKATFPDMEVDALDKIIGDGAMSIGFAQAMLFDLYESYLRRPHPPWPSGDTVTVDDLRAFFLERFLRDHAGDRAG